MNSTLRKPHRQPTMFRSCVSRAAALRAYSTQPAYSTQSIEQLLERVKKLTSNPSGSNTSQKKTAQKFQKSKGAQYQTQKEHHAQAQPRGSKHAENQQPREKKPFQQRAKLASDSKTSVFNEVSSDFVAPQPFKKPYTQRNATPRLRRTPMLTNKLRDMDTSAASSSAPSPRQRNARRQRNQTPTARKPKAVALPRSNPNVTMINPVYIPEVPTLDSLIEDSPITSQTAESRILKAYRELKHDSEANVSSLLTGQFTETSDKSFTGQLATDALKRNAAIVVSALNKNGSLDYETKMKLLMPLSGLAPVKQLSA